MPDPLIILVALICGLLSRAFGLPALLGYLAAGFVLHEFGFSGGEFLDTISEIGVTLLLFTIGLKLQPRELLKTRIWGTTVIHMLAMQGLFMGVLLLANTLYPGFGLGLSAVALIAFALTFSSTVFVIQVMQERGELASRHANLAIGILVIQDLAAVIFLAFSTGKMPEPTALLLLLLWPLRGVILRLMAHSGHGELFTLFGLALAIGGAQLFESVGIKGDLGALMIGAALAGHQKSKELSRNLLTFKDLFLVGFFLSIGLAGWPTPQIIVLSVLIGLLAIIKPLLYFPLLTRFHTNARTAFLSSSALTNFSEFGLIVISVAVGAGWVEAQWSSAISLIIAVSFVVSSPVNKYAHSLYFRWRETLLGWESHQLRSQLPDLSGVKIVVLGMGNIGTGTYDAIAEGRGDAVLGVDVNPQKLARHRQAGRRVAAADASDPGFWQRANLDQVELILLVLTNQQENLQVSRLLSDLGYKGRLAAVVRFAEEENELTEQGISAFNLYAQAGAGFAAHVAKTMELESQHGA